MASLIGKLVVGQSGGCTHVINSSLRGVVAQALRSKAIRGVWGMRDGIEGALRCDFLDLARERAETLRAIARAPAAALGACRRKISDDEAREVVALFRRNDVRYLVYIGGNDSADTSHRIVKAAARAGYALRVMAVPKTIDNDLTHTDHCPGYGSAARFIACATHDTGIETEAMTTVEPVKIVEVMGRNAGWLAAASALAKRSERDAPQFIWPPEVPFDRKLFTRLVERWLGRIGYCVIVVSETIRDRRGRPIAALNAGAEKDPFGHPRLAGAAEWLCALVQATFGVRARWDKPGTIQRTASRYFSPSDLREAQACGAYAVRFAVAGGSDSMVVMRRRRGARYRIEYDAVPIERVANHEKLLPAAFFDRALMLPTAAFRRYALPLVGPRLSRHARLRKVAARVIR